MTTPQESQSDLARAVGIDSLCLKREDLHPYGSHKGRSIPIMIDAHMKKGARHFAISSSGNAALAAALYIKGLNKKGGEKTKEKIRLEILVGNKIPDRKMKKLTDLADENISVMRFERPLQTLTQKTADGSIQSLRQSTDDAALLGYASLGKELENIKGLAAIFMPTSSGTTAEALCQHFRNTGVEVHIVQTTSCHPMALEFVDSIPSEEESTADAIVDTTARRKDILVPFIKETGGAGWIATNQEISTAQELIAAHANIKVSPNGALGVAGLMQAHLAGKEWDGAVACVIGGE